VQAGVLKRSRVMTQAVQYLPPSTGCCGANVQAKPAEAVDAAKAGCRCDEGRARMTRHVEASALLAASPATVFARLDDQTRLAEHMGKSSAMMGGGRMTYDMDAAKGQAVGSHIRMDGEAFGLKVSLDEVITEREPPRRKVWETVGEPKLIIVGRYVMGFELEPGAGASRLRVWIDYAPPAKGLGRLAPWLGAFYARWCVDQMVQDAVRHFGGSLSKAELRS
jgi:hypothetical protein